MYLAQMKFSEVEDLEKQEQMYLEQEKLLMKLFSFQIQ